MTPIVTGLTLKAMGEVDEKVLRGRRKVVVGCIERGEVFKLFARGSVVTSRLFLVGSSSRSVDFDMLDESRRVVEARVDGSVIQGGKKYPVRLERAT